MGGSECILTSDELETMSHSELKQRLTTGEIDLQLLGAWLLPRKKNGSPSRHANLDGTSASARDKLFFLPLELCDVCDACASAKSLALQVVSYDAPRYRRTLCTSHQYMHHRLAAVLSE